ncbi:serine/threonine-protein kinase [Burkholderia sp. Ac-20353]|uniref:serine/threonine protein kinase n=1 Tax=Burkholderia sp. Ac-20353 TaxID=2703894 RepID=UPI00197B1AAF|nr:serine/threonine-protein kinase [Burkholderia sp. Ac-20353]MBN3793025.1 serine/threonine protein kinase [Burkholderia sp. Ac-20353]
MKDPVSRDNEQETTDRGSEAGFAVRPLPLGHRLGELQLDEVLGVGGFGIVYRAFDRTLRRAVAIKEYMPSMLATRGGDYTVSLRSERFAQAFDAGRAAFLNEARLLAQFDHPGLVKVLHFWESHGTAYMVMPFYEGRTLKQLLDGGVQMGETQLRNVVGALLGALDTLHRAQCFHRDVALDNVLIRPDGSAILLDFGAARKRIGDLVDDGAMMIKPGYAPIEQYTDDPAFSQGPWTDLYALGAVMHAMIAGELPPAAVVRSIQDTYRPLATRALAVRELYSPALLAAVDHALQVRIEDRPDSVAAFAAELGLREPERHGYGAGQAPARPAADEAGANAGQGSAVPQSATPNAAAGQAAAHHATGPGATPRNDTGGPAAAASPGAAARVTSDDTRPGIVRRLPGDRRTQLFVGGAIALLLVIGISTAYLMKPARDAEPASSANPPQASTPSPAPGSNPAVSLASPGPAPALAPPVTAQTPADASAQASAPVVADVPASESVVPPSPPSQVAANDAGTGAGAAPRSTSPSSLPSSPATSGPSLAPAGSLDASERVVNVPSGDNAARPAAAPAAATPATTAMSSAATTATTATTAALEAAPEPRPPEPPPETVAVRFHVRPWGDIYVSGVRRGASPPLRSVSLSPGTYQIEIRNGTLPPLRRTVKIDAGSKPISIDYAFE